MQADDVSKKERFVRTIAWQSHLTVDLSPFVCLYDVCNTPDTLYPSMKEWKDHVSTQHGTDIWRCMSCMHDNRTGWNTVNFQEKHSFLMHLRNSHRLLLPASKLNTIAELSSRKLVYCCIICDFSPMPMRILEQHPDRTYGDTPEEVWMCMSNHMKEIRPSRSRR
ncbi:hypothetical protein K431DRAFT_17871 [Polychaeton citri CBS 116435]|uniref:C2H2-type domain-containing protein n=1 Tax=Polychaeton citri CBS 116435 TaxID=1314669 RepID=A0A9P4QF86_9PEZI|nr:hypothetical protein K431DRAFT_17871 [Polychaeton citri CBS 116435]